MIIQRLFSLRGLISDQIKLKNNIVLKRLEYGVIARFLRNFKYFRKKQDELVFYDAYIDGKPIGMIQISEEVPNIEVNINWLIIRKEYQGKGYATEIMKAVIDEIKKLGYKKVTLEVPYDDGPAIHIYKKLGFKEVEPAEDGDDNLIYMEKTFSKLPDSRIGVGMNTRDRIKKSKSFAYLGNISKKIVSDKDIAKGVAKQVSISTNYIKEHPFDPGLLRKKTVKRVSVFSKK